MRKIIPKTIYNNTHECKLVSAISERGLTYALRLLYSLEAAGVTLLFSLGLVGIPHLRVYASVSISQRSLVEVSPGALRPRLR